MLSDLLSALATSMVGVPILGTVGLGLLMWFIPHVPETVTRRFVAVSYSVSALLGLVAAAVMAFTHRTTVRVELGEWFHIGELGFELALQLDRLSIPFFIFGCALIGIVGIFSSRYLHKESGFNRFYLQLSILGSGFIFVVMAGSIDLIFIGWGVVGLSSALLVAYFQDRAGPVRHGLMAFVGYRICDSALLGAIVWLHHTRGNTGFSPNAGPWWGLGGLGESDALIVGSLLIAATLAKSAQLPLSDWLPRAMEGPTPSSAVFYGALSIHLGPYLLLRIGDLISSNPALQVLIIGIGTASALHATFVGRVQTDIKSSLAYASMGQVSIIFIEIGLGFRMLALIHIVGHASFRTLQILRSPSILHEHHHLEQAMGGPLPRTGGHIARIIPKSLQPWLYRLALERGYFLGLWRYWFIAPIARIVRWHDRLVDVEDEDLAAPKDLQTADVQTVGANP